MTKNSKKNNPSSRIAEIIAVILAILLVVSVIISCGTIYWGWFDKDSATTEDTTAAADESNNLVVNDASSSGISLAMTALSGSNELGGTVYSGTTTINGESVDYESSYEVTATVDDEATDRTITWTLSCSGISNISSYVVLSSDTSEAGESITVYCLQPFSYQITLTAASGDVTATCTLDYVARVTGFTLRQLLNGQSYDEDSDSYFSDSAYVNIASTSLVVTWTANDYLVAYANSDFISESGGAVDINSYLYGTGSVKDDLTLSYIDLRLADDVEDAILKALGIETFEYSISSNMSNGFNMSDILNAVFSNEENGNVNNAMSQASYKLKVYNVFKSYYEAGTPVFKITMRTYSNYFETTTDTTASVLFNPAAYYATATSVSLDNTELYF